MNKADQIDLPASIKPEDAEAYRVKVAHMTGSNLPVIIDAPGEYITRSGQRAVIDRIDSPEKATANCKGTLYFPPVNAATPEAARALAMDQARRERKDRCFDITAVRKK